MLAGDMKLKTFLGLAGLGVLGAAALTGWWLVHRPAAPPPALPRVAISAPAQAPPPQAVPAATTPAATTPAATTPTPTDLASAAPVSALPPAERPADSDMLRFVGRDLHTAKMKDVTQGKAWKVNVYQDAGHTSANRAKLDLDRDDHWDEKWSFEDDGTILREVAPQDDEQYTQRLVWDGARWTQG